MRFLSEGFSADLIGAVFSCPPWLRVPLLFYPFFVVVDCSSAVLPNAYIKTRMVFFPLWGDFHPLSSTFFFRRIRLLNSETHWSSRCCPPFLFHDIESDPLDFSSCSHFPFGEDGPFFFYMLSWPTPYSFGFFPQHWRLPPVPGGRIVPFLIYFFPIY